MEEVSVAICTCCNRPDLLNTYTPATLPHAWVCPSCKKFRARGGSEIGSDADYYEEEPPYCCHEPHVIVEPQIDGSYFAYGQVPSATVEGPEAYIERNTLRRYDAIVREQYPDTASYIWHSGNNMHEWGTVDDIPYFGVVAGYCTNCDSETCVEVTD